MMVRAEQKSEEEEEEAEGKWRRSQLWMALRLSGNVILSEWDVGSSSPEGCSCFSPAV